MRGRATIATGRDEIDDDDEDSNSELVETSAMRQDDGMLNQLVRVVWMMATTVSDEQGTLIDSRSRLLVVWEATSLSRAHLAHDFEVQELFRGLTFLRHRLNRIRRRS